MYCLYIFTTYMMDYSVVPPSPQPPQFRATKFAKRHPAARSAARDHRPDFDCCGDRVCRGGCLHAACCFLTTLLTPPRPARSRAGAGSGGGGPRSRRWRCWASCPAPKVLSTSLFSHHQMVCDSPDIPAVEVTAVRKYVACSAVVDELRSQHKVCPCWHVHQLVSAPLELLFSHP
jgi:hypothetical protein